MAEKTQIKPTTTDLAGACAELSAIPYFPKEEGAHAAIIRGLSSFVGEKHHLRWLIDTAVDHMREWKGVAELRALYCTRFRPADGVEGQDCQIHGFSPVDSEAMHLSNATDRNTLHLVDAAAVKMLKGAK